MKKRIFILGFLIATNTFSAPADIILSNAVRRVDSCNLSKIIKEIQSVHIKRFKVVSILRSKKIYMLTIKDNWNGNRHIIFLKSC